MSASSRPAALRLLLWCLLGGAVVQAMLWTWTGRNVFSPIFRALLLLYDGHGNVLLLALAVLAFFLRRQPVVLAAVRVAGERPWALAVLLFPLFCAGSLRVYHDYPLSMDEYAAVFQAKAFAAGRLAGAFPPDLLDFLIPPFFQNVFLNVSRASGDVSSTYWPGFALLLAPFAWLDATWAANPAIGALAIPAIHRLARQLSGSTEAAGWAVLLTLASPAFTVASISYYSMQAHLLCNVLFALLLLQPTVLRALAAGLVGSLAVTLHQPVSHLLFLAPFALWLLARPGPGSARILAALALGYLPLVLLLGVGWHYHLIGLARGAGAVAAASASPALLDSFSDRLGAVIALPGIATVEARFAGLSKVWTWGSPGLLVLAAWGYRAGRATAAAKLLGAALVVTYFGYFFFPIDQGHGWGYRYLHSAWFVMPVLAAVALAGAPQEQDRDLRGMVAWAAVLSLVVSNSLRLVQVDAFLSRHLAQVPPLATPADRSTPQLVFVNMTAGFYTRDMVQNDPFLRESRITMVHAGRERTAELVRRRFPDYVRSAQGDWGELWTAQRPTPSGK